MNLKAALAMVDANVAAIRLAQPDWSVARKVDPRCEIAAGKTFDLQLSPGLCREGVLDVNEAGQPVTTRGLIRGEVEVFFRFRYQMDGKKVDDILLFNEDWENDHIEREEWLRLWFEARQSLEVLGLTFVYDGSEGAVELSSLRSSAMLVMGGRVLFHYFRPRQRYKPLGAS